MGEGGGTKENMLSSLLIIVLYFDASHCMNYSKLIGFMHIYSVCREQAENDLVVYLDVYVVLCCVLSQYRL